MTRIDSVSWSDSEQQVSLTWLRRGEMGFFEVPR